MLNKEQYDSKIEHDQRAAIELLEIRLNNVLLQEDSIKETLQLKVYEFRKQFGKEPNYIYKGTKIHADL